MRQVFERRYHVGQSVWLWTAEGLKKATIIGRKKRMIGSTWAWWSYTVAYDHVRRQSGGYDFFRTRRDAELHRKRFRLTRAKATNLAEEDMGEVVERVLVARPRKGMKVTRERRGRPVR